MSSEATLTIVVTVALALTGYGLKYWSDVRLAGREAQLARINRQLSELYGPLFALTHAGHAAWMGLWDRAGRNPREFFLEFDPTFVPIWQSWMTHIFMPLNRQMVALVVEKADLLVESAMPEILWELCAHVYSWEGVIGRWEAGDDSELTSAVPFPREALMTYVGERFGQLKAEQVRLLGTRARSPSLPSYQ